MKSRNSSIELFKLIGMILIVIFHCYFTITMQYTYPFPLQSEGVDFASLPIGITKGVLLIIGFFGNTGNLIFLACSMWFLCESRRTSLQKVLVLVLTNWILSIVHLIVIPVLFPVVELTDVYIYRCLFPLSYQQNWFLTCYIELYLIHGALNIVIENLSQSLHLLVVTVTFFLFSVIRLYAKFNFFYSSEIVVCITIYFLIAYIKKYSYNRKTGIRLFIVGISGFAVLLILKRLGIPASIREEGFLYFSKMTNPFLIFIVIGTLLLSSQRYYYNEVINYLSGLSLTLYLIHENKLFRDIVRQIIWQSISSSMHEFHLLIRFFVFSVTILFYGVGASIIFNEIVMPHIKKISVLLETRMVTLWNMFCGICIK